MRVCLVSRELAPFSGWGIGTYAAHMAVALARAGDDVHILTNRAPDLYEGPCRRLAGAHVHLLDDLASDLPHMPVKATMRPLAILAKLREITADEPFDVIEFADLYADAYHCVQAKRTLGDFERTALGVRLHSPIFLLRDVNRQRVLNRKVAIVEHMEIESIRGADLLFAPSRAIIDRVTARLGGRIRAPWRDDPTPIHLHRNPFDPQLLAPPPVVRIDRPPRRDTILAYGRLEYRKGFHLLIQAATRLLEDGRDIRVRIVGADTDTWPGRRSVRAQLEALVPDEWPDRFSFERNVPRERLVEEIREAALCCFPSLWENFPYACLEAMGAGALVVGSDAGGMAEIIEHDRSGYLFRAGDVNHLARVLTTALSGEGVRARIADNAPRRVRELTEPTASVNRFHDAVRAVRPPVLLAAEGPPPSVSVIIAHKDMPETLGAAVDSAREQTRQPDRIIIVDDGSETAEAHDLVDRLEHELDVTVIRQANAGLAGARNAAIDAAATDYIVPLDADDRLAPDFLERTLGAVLREPDLAMVTTLMSCFKSAPGRPEFGFAPIGLDRDTLVAFNAASSCTALLRRDAVIRAGRYDADLWAYEDWDLYCAMAARNMRSALVPEYLVHNRVRDDSMLRSISPDEDHQLRAVILAKHPNLAEHPDRAQRLLLAQAAATAAAARKPRPAPNIDIQVKRTIQSTPRYRLADKAARIARRTGLAPIIKTFLRS